MKELEISKSGMSEEKLLEICSGKNDCIVPHPVLFWTAEVYGLGKYIRKYGYYPKLLPLAIYTDHGVGCIPDKPWKHELESYAPVMFYHSPESVKIWKKFSNKPCYTLYSPFVFYRRSNKIIQDKNAKGTIVFPNHTLTSMDEIYDVQAYIDQLNNLPEKFQPVSVCLHKNDIKIGRHKIYLKNNIPVYTAGGNCKYFIERFYNILKKFKYASSNEVCSSLFYTVEMGIPFFIHGNRPENINKSDSNMPLGKWDPHEGNKYYPMIYKLFSNPECEITDEKRKLVESDLGIYDGISRIKMTYILYSSLLKMFFSKACYQEFGKPGIRYLIREMRKLWSVKK